MVSQRELALSKGDGSCPIPTGVIKKFNLVWSSFNNTKETGNLEIYRKCQDLKNFAISTLLSTAEAK